jgi:sec-independent protein translocase protein TatA
MVAAVGPFGLGPLELVIILLVLVMLFGATRLADIGGSLGKGIREFRKNVKDGEEDEDDLMPAPRAQATTVAPPVATTNGAPAEGVVQAVKCPSCESLNPAGARHCNQCGTALATPVS